MTSNQTFLWADAKCNGKTDLFYSLKFADIYEAQKLCHICPHIQACKGRSVGEYNGVWGGEFKSLNSTSKRRYEVWKKKQIKAEAELIRRAEGLGISSELARRITGYRRSV